MRTTLDLPRELIEEGMKVTQEKTKTALITKAVEELIRWKKIQDLKELGGTMPNLDLDLNTLRGRESKWS